ncbi:MAG TPA: hypothetical protein VNJ46_01180 [Gaiellaceae bacterium]|nr:hypothetical protein [Gaiellaceae bacterium]
MGAPTRGARRTPPCGSRLAARRRAPRAALALACAALALVAAAGGRAGSTQATFDLLVQPQILTEGKRGFALGKFVAAEGPGIGSATHVSIVLEVRSALLDPTPSAPDCVQSSRERDGASYHVFTCPVGTVNAGGLAIRWVTYTAPDVTSPLDFAAFGHASFDRGSGGAPGGGGTDVTGEDTGLATVVDAAHPNRAGDCGGRPSTAGAPLSVENPLSTSIVGGSPDPAVPLPPGCTWAFAGENPPAGNSLTWISFVGFPQTAQGAPVEWVLSLHALPVSFPKLKVLFDASYTAGSTAFAGQALERCQGGALAPAQTACVKLLEKVGRGARAVILARSFGEDPGAGFG